MTATTLVRPARRAATAQRRRPRFAATPAGRASLGTVSVIAAFAAWEVVVRTGLVPASAIPPASSVLAEFGAQLGSAALWAMVWDTVSVVLLGLALIVVVAAPLALLIGLVRTVEESTWFVLEFLKPIPPVALIPLGLLLWGPSPGMKLFLIVLGAVWPLLTQLVYGVREVHGAGTDLARSYRLGWWLTTSRIVIPSILPFALTGARISAAIAVIVSVVTEMIGGAAGLGQGITVAQSAGALPEMYALILAAGLLGLVLNAGFRALEKPLLFWHPSVRKEASA